jgi:hypothetical protein
MTENLQSSQIYIGSYPFEHTHGFAAVLAFGTIKLLAGHTSHVLGPTSRLNVYAPQELHAFARPEKPTSHEHCSLPACAKLLTGQEVHALTLVAAKAGENVLLGHALHGKLPVTVLYVPIGHSSHQSGQIFVMISLPCTCTSLNVT